MLTKIIEISSLVLVAILGFVIITWGLGVISSIISFVALFLINIAPVILVAIFVYMVLNRWKEKWKTIMEFKEGDAVILIDGRVGVIVEIKGNRVEVEISGQGETVYVLPEELIATVEE